ncbi:protein-transporting protein [Saccharomycopsis crataegensis]|uniref:Protein BCP1 n=1 Tax=Saccharomycopsis crataegensis TaxID=43959 RepID=A0AAV5QJI4_9ASCO|nr:protein-transporting protein [Saccharomycopsis crataegensis]
MPKRTASEKDQEEKLSKKVIQDEIEFSDDDEELDSDEDNEGEGDDNEIINVDFDFFDLNPEIDFHGFRTFLKQLFGDDYKKFDLSGLANIILDPKNTSIGSTIKTDGKDGDPLALLALMNLKNYKKSSSLNTLIEYLVTKAQGNPEFYIILKKVLGMNGGEKVGLIINERIINVPVEVTPPLFKLMMEEVNKQEPDLKYFLIISKVYKLVASQLSDDSDSDSDDNSNKNNKAKKVKKNSENQEEFDYFHYEDMIFEKNAMKFDKFKYDNKLQDTDSRRVFSEYGIDPYLSLILIEKSKLESSIPQLEEAFKPF